MPKITVLAPKMWLCSPPPRHGDSQRHIPFRVGMELVGIKSAPEQNQEPYNPDFFNLEPYQPSLLEPVPQTLNFPLFVVVLSCALSFNLS